VTVIRRSTLCALLFFCLAAPFAVQAADDCASRVEQLETKNQQLHQQLRQARRELAQTQTAEHKPGWPQVLGGIGIIFGLCGVAMMVSAKRKTR